MNICDISYKSTLDGLQHAKNIGPFYNTFNKNKQPVLCATLWLFNSSTANFVHWLDVTFSPESRWWFYRWKLFSCQHCFTVSRWSYLLKMLLLELYIPPRLKSVTGPRPYNFFFKNQRSTIENYDAFLFETKTRKSKHR